MQMLRSGGMVAQSESFVGEIIAKPPRENNRGSSVSAGKTAAEIEMTGIIRFFAAAAFRGGKESI